MNLVLAEVERNIKIATVNKQEKGSNNKAAFFVSLLRKHVVAILHFNYFNNY